MKHPDPHKPFPHALAAFAVAAAIVLGGIVFTAETLAVNVLAGLLIDGGLVALYATAAAGWGWALTGRFTRDVTPALRGVTAVAVGLGGVGLVAHGLGLAELLSASWIITLLIGGGVLLAWAVWKASAGRNAPAATGRFAASPLAWWAVAFAAPLVIVLLAASVFPGQLWKPLDPHPYDVLSYHLQVPREWYDAGRIVPLRHNAFSFFPMLIETHFLAMMHLRGGPWDGMYAAQLVSVLHTTLAVAATYAAVRALGFSRNRAFCAALLTATTPWVLMLAGVAYVEPGVMLYTTLAAAWAAVSVVGRPSLRPAALAGATAGLACGCKYTAFAMTAMPVVIALVGTTRFWFLPLRGKQEPQTATRLSGFSRGVYAFMPAFVAVLFAALLAGPWLARNVVWTGNPVFPLATSIFGRAQFEPDQVERYARAHRPRQGQDGIGARLASAFGQTVTEPQYGYVAGSRLPLVAAAFGAAGVLAFRRRDTAVMAIIVVLMTGVWVVATHVIGRFETPAIPLAAVLIAAAPWHRWATYALAAVHAATGLWIVTGFAIERVLPGFEDMPISRLELARLGLFRLERADLGILETPETQAARTSGDRVAMIGDAQVFMFNVPSDRLLYRSVFDVHIPSGTSLVDGWLGRPVDALRREGCWVVINTSELARLSATYFGLPKPAPPYDVVRPEPIVLPPLPPAAK